MNKPMIFKMGIQYERWLAKRKPDELFEWGQAKLSGNTQMEHVKKQFKDMDEEEREAAFRRAVFSAVHDRLL